MVGDPFLEAGIVIPSDLPYQNKVTENSSKMENKEEKRDSMSNMAEKQELIRMDTINVTTSN